MSERPLVVVVDDSDSVRESLPDLLQHAGFVVRAFASAEAFLASDAVAAARCLILDVGLPGMSGPALQRELVRRGSRVPDPELAQPAPVRALEVAISVPRAGRAQPGGTVCAADPTEVY